MRDADDSPTYEPICFQRELCGIKWSHLYMVKYGFESKWLKNMFYLYRSTLYDNEFESILPTYQKRLCADKRKSEFQQRRETVQTQGYDMYCKIYGWNRSFREGEDEAIPVITQHYDQESTIMKFNMLNHIITHLQNYIDDGDRTEEETDELIQKEYQTIQKFEKGTLERYKLQMKFTFHGHCPLTNCPGLITSIMRCQYCNTEVCPDCKMRKMMDHKCNKSDLLSLQLLEGDSKRCPHCGILVFKTEGCNDMYCTRCQTSFNWGTLVINRGFIPHNPHLAEMRERMRRQHDGSSEDSAENGQQTTETCLDLFDWSALQKSLIGCGKSAKEKLEEPQTVTGSKLKVFFHIVRELDMMTRNYTEQDPNRDHQFKYKLAKDWLNKKINRKIRRDRLWKQKVENDYFDELNMIRRAWVESVMAVMSNFVFNRKKDKKYKTQKADEDFREQIRMISKFTRDSLFLLGENSHYVRQLGFIFPIFEIEGPRFRVLKKDSKIIKSVLNEYFITEKMSKEFMERRLLI